MKIKFLKSQVPRNRSHFGFATLASLIAIWLALTPGAAQSKNQKRITALQIGQASEGSRVTVVSDSALNDYEAFRRGDRFYVRIPLAEFTGRPPGFRGDGFDDVQVQKVGDSVVVSFKLQPGATARVDQRSNRLDVIFSVVNRGAFSARTSAGSNRGSYVPPDGIVRVNNPQILQHRGRDAAGPMPPGSPGSPETTRERVVSGRTSDFQSPRGQSSIINSREDSGRTGSNRPAGNGVAPRSGTSSRTIKSNAEPSIFREESSTLSKSAGSSSLAKAEPSPTISKYGPSPTVSPAISPGYSALTTSTPAAPGVSPPVKSSGSTGWQNWKNRGDVAVQWVKANRQASLLGGLLLLVILVFLAALLIRRRRKNVVKSKRSGTTLTPPKQPADAGISTAAAASSTSNGPRDLVHENTARPRASEPNPPNVPVLSANSSRTSGIQDNAERGKPAPERAKAQSAAVATPPNHAWVPAGSAKGSSSDEDQEREVFEI